MDEMVLSPEGKKKLLGYKNTEEKQSIFGRPETDDIAQFTGCTATVVVITPTEIICGNAGDSRTVLSKGRKAFDLSIDHKPDNPGEKRRIEQAGGFVEENRVKGVLNLSRSLGDMEYKQDKALKPEQQMITAVPEIKTHKRGPDCDFLILACDGIWDCLTSQEAVEYVDDGLKGKPATNNLIVERMFDKIIAADVASSGGIGCDNMTCIVVSFKK